jgi:hypothetical protein
MTASQRIWYLQQEIIRVGNGCLVGVITQEEWQQRAGLLLKRLRRLRPSGRAG